MSGPKTAIFTVDPVAVLLAASGINAAMAVREGYANAAALRKQHQDQSASQEQKQHAAEDRGRLALNEEVKKAELAFAQMDVLADQLGIVGKVNATRPLQPDAADSLAVAAYVRAMEALVAELRTILLTEAVRQFEQLESMPDIAFDAASRASVPQNISQRLLARIAPIAHLEAIPADIHTLALELEQTLPGERATLLATELRARVQAYIESVQQQQVRTATSIVLSQSLKDLGYQVEEVSNTLFVDGGVVHFRRQGWGNYMVRMRIDATSSAANFNIVRAVSEGENERSVLDHLAEDRWCSEFPALLKALEVRGVQLKVTRQLAAGELPVQLVSASKLPQFTEDDRTMISTKPLAKQLT